MNLQGCLKLAAFPTSSVSKSITSLCCCLLPGAAAAPSLRSLVLSASVDHVPLLCPALGWRGFCWVRRTPPFSRDSALKASLVQDSPCTEIPASLEGEAHLRSTDARHVSFNNGTSSCLTPAFSGNAFAGAHSAATAAAGLCEVNVAAGDALRHCPSDDILSIANGPGHSRDVDPYVSGAADCLSPQPCDMITIKDIGEAPQTSRFPSASPGFVNSSVNFWSLSNATASKETSGLQTTKTEASKGPQLRRMLNSNHALVRDLKDEKMQWFPYLDQFRVKDHVLTSTQIMQMLGPFMLEERKDRIRRVVANRTYAVCVVVEGLLDLGNIAAIFRTADALGFQSVEVIANETERRYKKNRRISMGSEKWLDAELFNITEDCFEELRSRGYRVAVASVTADSVWGSHI